MGTGIIIDAFSLVYRACIPLSTVRSAQSSSMDQDRSENIQTFVCTSIGDLKKMLAMRLEENEAKLRIVTGATVSSVGNPFRAKIH